MLLAFILINALAFALLALALRGEAARLIRWAKDHPVHAALGASLLISCALRAYAKDEPPEPPGPPPEEEVQAVKTNMLFKVDGGRIVPVTVPARSIIDENGHILLEELTND